MPDPVDAGPATQPSLEARPDPLESPRTDHQPRSARSEPIATAEDPGATADEAPPEEAPPEEAPPSEPVPVPAQPVVVPGQYHYLKRWTFVVVLIGVWIPAALIGLALYYYWFHSLNKTPAVFLVLMFIVVSTIGAQLLAMAEHQPLIRAASIALLSAPFAATAAAAALYGAYVFHWIAR